MKYQRVAEFLTFAFNVHECNAAALAKLIDNALRAEQVGNEDSYHNLAADAYTLLTGKQTPITGEVIR